MIKLHGAEPEEPAFEPLGARLKEVRKHYKFSQTEFAVILGISRGSCQYYERDERDVPVSVVKTFIEHFQLDAEWVLFGDVVREVASKKRTDE